MRPAVLILLSGLLYGDAPPQPHLDRVTPLGALRGASVTVELTGEYLSNTQAIWFDCPDIRWVETLEAGFGLLRGKVSVDRAAALGPHLLNVRGKDGRSNSRLFNVAQFPAAPESEPNDPPGPPQRIDLKPQVIYGYLKGHADVDAYSFRAKAGQRFAFDLRSIEHGGFLECEMALTDERGKSISFSDDRDDYLETPFLEHVFARDGVYQLRIDQYRGPQGVDCGANCGYLLQVSQLPVVESASPLGARAGAATRFRLTGKSLEQVEQVCLTRVRAGEYYRLTFPFSMPVRIGRDPAGSELPRISGRIAAQSAKELTVDFAIPAKADLGLWRVWVSGPAGAADGVNIEIADLPEFGEQAARAGGWPDGEAAINGTLDRDGEEDAYPIQARAGQPLHVWTLATQMGLPSIDTVLELFDENGKLVAEHDDLMTGQGTVIGNPDSSLYYTPPTDQRLRLVVRDRIGRGGPTFAYRLRTKSEPPGFQLLTEPEELNVTRGGEAEISALLIREPGFREAVDVWVEGLPSGMEAPRGQFRADQYFGPSDDGDNVIIPEVALKIQAPDDLVPGEYPIRVLGRRAGGGPVVEAFTTLWIGPRSKRNDVRRPLPAITFTVVEPARAQLVAEPSAIPLERGGAAKLAVAAKGVAPEAPIRVGGLPPGVSYRIADRRIDGFEVRLEAGAEAELAVAKLSVEANVEGRWVAAAPVTLTLRSARLPAAP